MPEGTGARNVKTCLQSGNAVVDGGHKGASRFADRFSAATRLRHGFGSPVLLPDPGEREKAITGNTSPRRQPAPVPCTRPFRPPHGRRLMWKSLKAPGKCRVGR